ncbi:AAA family ATPase [Pseudomonas viridiflava]|uniref:AAA family ATPase n=1 Tax=Pseudomonas viridiflava TaxID=33069 RepID=UPI000F01737D|nr:AAA family ATPase [Pseudomonas viridiflava]
MQRIERPDQPPTVLMSPEAQASRKAMLEFWQLGPERRAQTSVPVIGYSSEEPQLRDALAAMSGHRCAFCEASDGLQVYRFRPVGNALPLAKSSDAHLYYLWLADAWHNLLPICAGCVPIEPHFPVRGARCPLPSVEQVQTYVARGNGIWSWGAPNERAQLLDPAQEPQFTKHLIPTLDGELLPGTRRGEATIYTFDLNRSERRDQRYHTYESRLDDLQAFLAASSQAGIEPILDFSDLEFGGTWYLLLRRLLNHVPMTGIARNLSASQIAPALQRLAQSTDAAAIFEQSLLTLRREDIRLRANGRQAMAPNPAKDSVCAIQINNFKAIEQLELNLKEHSARTADGKIKPVPSLVILGENATGKSSILEAIALTLVPAAVRNALAVPWSDLVIDPSQLGIERSYQAGHAQIRIGLTNQHWVTLSIDHHTHLHESSLGNQQVPVFAYGAFRRFTRTSPRTTTHSHVRNLFDGTMLPNPEPWLIALRQDRFDMVIRTLRDVLAVEGDFDVIQRNPGSRDLRVVTAVTELDGTTRYNRTPFHAVSSGYRSMLAMICDIMKGLMSPAVYPEFESFQSARGVVLIDEIEAHLHPRWKVQVMSRLRAALPNITFIVTTHDPLCLRGMEDGEVAVLQRIPTSESQVESQLPIIIESMEGLPSVANLRLEQLLTSDFFQMLSTDDAHTDRRLAMIADLVGARARGEVLTAEDERVLNSFRNDIASALPIGSSEVHQIIQEAVAEYLSKRRIASSQTLRRLRREAKDEILAALERF